MTNLNGRTSDGQKNPRTRIKLAWTPSIEEAVVDCYNEYEEIQGFVNMIEENVVCPFNANVIGEEVEVVELHGPDAGFGIDVVCRWKATRNTGSISVPSNGPKS